MLDTASQSCHKELAFHSFSFFQVTGNVIVGCAIVTQDGKEKTATAPRAQTPACPAVVSCAAAGVSVIVEFAFALSLVPTEPPVRNAPPALMPAR